MLEVVAVVDSSLYSERTRAALYRYLSPVKPGQPQRERQTKLYIIPRSSFSRTYRTMRNLVLVERSDSLSGLTTARNVYAAPQNVFTLRASDERQAAEQSPKAATISSKPSGDRHRCPPIALPALPIPA